MDNKKRINRIIGQINGIKKMIDADRDCLDVLQQIVAVRSALAGLAVNILKKQACQKGQKNNLELVLNKLFQTN
jgi:DNA-binding FrmR family transcriptional regulator